MTDYTERFRTLSIPQMQQVLAVLSELATDPWVGHSVKGRIETILAPPFNVDPADEAQQPESIPEAGGAEDIARRLHRDGLANPEPGDADGSWLRTDPTIIRAAEGVTLEPGEYEIVTVNDTDPRLKPGDVARPEKTTAMKQLAAHYNGAWAWLFLDGGPSTWVTAVRRVDPKPSSEPVAPAAGGERSPLIVLRPPERRDELEDKLDAFVLLAGGEETAPSGPTIIRAAEGVTLEPGEYEDADGARWKFSVKVKTEAVADASGNCFWRMPPPIGLVEAVRRVDPKPASEPVATAVLGMARFADMNETRAPVPKPSARTVNWAREDMTKRVKGCTCQLEEGDSPCVVHTEFAEVAPAAAAAGGERAIVVGSTWAFNGNEDRVILSIDPIEVGIPGPVRTPHGTWKDEAVFRKLYTWVSDPAPPQQPAERVERAEPVPCAGSCCGDNPECQPRLALIRQRDAALATVAKLTAELEAAKAGLDVRGEMMLEAADRIEKLAKRNRNMRRALRDLNKIQSAKAEAIRAISHVPFAQRNDYLLEAKGKLTQRNNELRAALGPTAKNVWLWPELLAEVFRLRTTARTRLDPKACGKLIAQIRHELVEWAAYWGNHEPATDEAVQAADKLSAMLGVEVAGG